MSRFVYADNAATTPISPEVIAAMQPCFETVWGNPSSLHTTGQEAKETLEGARETIARLLGADSAREIYFTSGGSEADNQAIRSAAFYGAKKGKKRILPTVLCKRHHPLPG